MKILNNILISIATTLLTVSLIGTYQNLGVALPEATAVFETSLQSGIASNATSMTLTTNSIRGGGSLSGFNCFTVDQGSTNAETICGTVSGTSVTSMSRGISQSNGTTTVSALQFSHRRGASVKITDFPIIQRLKAQNAGEDTFENLLSYATSTSACTGVDNLCDKAYIDAIVNAGAATSTEVNGGIVELATQLEMASSTDLGADTPLVLQAKYATSSPSGVVSALYAIILDNAGKIAQSALNLTEAFTWTGLHTFNGGILSTASSTFSGEVGFNATTTFTGKTLGANVINSMTASTTITGATLPEAVYVSTTTGAILLSDGNDQDTVSMIGFAVTSGANNETVQIQTKGIVSGFTGLTAGLTYYVQDTAGDIGLSVGTYEIIAGIAISTTEILLDIEKGMQFMGSLSDSADSIAVPDLARFAIVDVTVVTSVPDSPKHELFLSKIGRTTANWNDQGGAGSEHSGTATWTGSTITLTGNGVSVSGTAYFYR